MGMGSSFLQGEGGVVLRRMSRIEDFEPLFALYELAFPPAERRGWSAFQEIFYRENAEFWRLEQGGMVHGFLNTWRFSECLYGEHFAVWPASRGRRIGEYALRCLLRAEALPFLVEVEPPTDSITQRRKAFYERLGLQVVSTTYWQPAYEPGGERVQLYLMSNDGGLRGVRLQRALHSVAKEVYRDANLKEMLGEYRVQ